MKLQELAQGLDLFALNPVDDRGDEITHGFTSDLLSDILAHARAGSVLVTTQLHRDLVAVAGLAGIRAVILSSGRQPDHDFLRRATEEKLTVFSSEADSFEVVGRLYQLGLHGGTRFLNAGPRPGGNRRRVHAGAAERKGVPLPAGTGGYE